MCQFCDQRRTVLLLMDLSAYADAPGADPEFADVVGFALSASPPGRRTPPAPATERTDRHARHPQAQGRQGAEKCATCKGSGEISKTVRVGRKHRAVGQQTGLCLTCFGSGEAN